MRTWVAALIPFILLPGVTRADDLLYSYDGDVLPYDENAGWIVADACGGQDACSEHLDGGFFSLEWSIFGNQANYHYQLSTPKTHPAPLPPFWVEWRFSSLKQLGNDPTADGRFSVNYRGMFEQLYMFGDAVVSADWGTVRRGFSIAEYRTHRLETPNGGEHCFFVNGRSFVCGGPGVDDGYSSLQFSGKGPISIGQFNRNSWDYVRYGRITYGEQIIASDPTGGFVDARIYAPLSRFTVTFDEPNYVLVDEVTVSVTEATERSSAEATNGKGRILRFGQNDSLVQGGIPQVTATRRRDNSPPAEVEIVLDRSIPFNATTRFTFDDGVAVNVVEFAFAPGDTDGDGDADLADFSYLANCFGASPLTSGPCMALDSNADGAMLVDDYAAFATLMHP
jgi:hypothetical protein